MKARYAIYYAPPADGALWEKASAWLGRDASRGLDLAQPRLPGLDDVDLPALTADPRGYGFHATLKAPFELAQGRQEYALLASVEGFAARQQPFVATIAPAALGRFLAFRIAGASPEMQALHEACMQAFESFRAPLSPEDLARRQKAPLTPEQLARVLTWGYPYAFEDFRFHMSLTGGIADDGLRTRLLDALQAYFAEESGPHRFDGVAVFRQLDRASPFDIVERFSFRASVPADA